VDEPACSVSVATAGSGQAETFDGFTACVGPDGTHEQLYQKFYSRLLTPDLLQGKGARHAVLGQNTPDDITCKFFEDLFNRMNVPESATASGGASKMRVMVSMLDDSADVLTCVLSHTPVKVRTCHSFFVPPFIVCQ
jgi:hypothetical protein